MTGQQLKNSILQEAIEGRLVHQDPNDEPASVLLERIRAEKARLVREKKIKKSALKEDTLTEEDILFDIPENWVWCKLGWIGDWGAGATPSKGNAEYYIDGTIPWLRTGELNNSYVYDSEIKVTEKALNNCSLRKCKIGDVLIAMYGATIGKVAIAGIELTTNQACCACTPYQVYNKYLLYYLMASKDRFIALGEGGAQPNISREKIIAFPFPLPPLFEQHRIVEKIESLLPKVEAYGKAQEELEKLNEALPEQLKRSILQEAIKGRLVPQDPNDEPASVLLERIRAEKARLVKEKKIKKDKNESRIYRTDDGHWMEHFEDKSREDICIDEEIPFDVPNGWEWCRFGLLVNTTTGKTPARGEAKYWSDSIYPWVSISDMKQGEYIYKTKEYISEVAAKECFSNKMALSGTLIMSFKLTVGRTSILGVNSYHNEAIISIETLCDGEKYTRDYLLYVLPIISNSGDSKNAIKGKTLNSTSIYNLLIPLPPLPEQHRIVEKLEEILPKLNELKKETDK